MKDEKARADMANLMSESNALRDRVLIIQQRLDALEKQNAILLEMLGFTETTVAVAGDKPDTVHYTLERLKEKPSLVKNKEATWYDYYGQAGALGSMGIKI